MELKKISPLSAARICGMFGVLVGLLALISIFILKSFASQEILNNLVAYSSVKYSLLVLLPVYYGVIYFIVGFLGAWLYNVFAKWAGGVHVEFGEARERKKR